MANEGDSFPKGGIFHGAATQARQENSDISDPVSGDTVDDPFWVSTAASQIQDNWDALFPYQLLIIEKTDQGTNSYSADTIKDRFTLPIPPQALSISMPFAITGSVTQGGYIEEHNGAPVRDIVLSGTTGLLPLRGTVSKANQLESSGIETVFAGTVGGIQNIQTAVSQVGNKLGVGTGSINALTEDELENDSDAIKGTGYYQFLLLKRFLETYASRKKAGEKNLRLGFAVWKESEVYLVTPVNFRVDRNASSGLEYPYTLQLRAWRRVILNNDSKSQAYEGTPGARDPNKMAAVLNTLETARGVLEGARDVLEGIRADIQQVLFTPLRQTMLLAKDATGVATTAADLPSNIIKDLKEPILEMTSTVEGFKSLGETFNASGAKLGTNGKALAEAFNSLAISLGKPDVKTGLQSPNSGRAAPINLRRIPSAAERGISNPANHYDLFSKIKTGALNLRPETIKKIEAEKKSVRALRRKNFESYRDQIQRAMSDFSDFVGAGASTYTRVYNLPTRTTDRTPTDSDWEVIFAMSQVCQAMSTLAVTEPVTSPNVSALDYVAGLASQSGIAFTKPASKFAVPFLYGHTLEQMAKRYLGDPARWHEIATLNGLQTPYVDEVGFQLSLLTNGNGNQILVSDSSRLFVNQSVWISSSTVRREKRRIQEIKILDSGQVAVKLDGESDLSKFTTISNAKIQAFLPNTVNSQQTIFIPSERAPDEDHLGTKSIPGVDYFDPIVRSNGITLLLDSDGDIVMTPWGQSRLAVGMVNAIQKIRLAAGTPKGALLGHPEYGFGIIPGTSTADRSAKDLLKDIKTFFNQDPGFTGVTKASVRKNANVARIAATIGIRGLGKFLPVEIESLR